MKKLFTLLLSGLCVSLMTSAVGAYSEDSKYEIPKVAVAPSIDGIMSTGEWDNALAIEMNKDTLKAIAGNLDTCPTGTFYWMWNEDGLYFFGDVNDTTKPDHRNAPDSGVYNNGDGIQVFMYPDLTTVGEVIEDMYCWTLVVANDGTAEIGEHYVYGGGRNSEDVDDAKVACTLDGNSYTIEAYFPTDCLEMSITPLTPVAGTTFAMVNSILEHDGKTQSLMIDSAWFDATKTNQYTLTADKTAGYKDASEVVIEDIKPVFTYPSSGVAIPEGSFLVEGELIGNETGWGDNADTGRAAAFDGNVNTFFDPLGVGDGYAGIDAGKKVQLTKIVIHPRVGYPGPERYEGARIDGSNDPDFAEFTTIYVSGAGVENSNYMEINAEDFAANGAFRYYRYYNTVKHGDVAEVELYAEPVYTYPSSGVAIPEGSFLVEGELIGNETGWGDNADTGRAAAFDGNINTFFDPLGVGNGYAGIDAGKEVQLTKIVIHPRASYPGPERYEGARIDGSNDPDFAEFTTIYVSDAGVTESTYMEINAEDFAATGSFRYYRYYNAVKHGDVAEVELYATTPVAVDSVEETVAPQTFDFGVISAVAAVISLAGYAMFKKR